MTGSWSMPDYQHYLWEGSKYRAVSPGWALAVIPISAPGESGCACAPDLAGGCAHVEVALRDVRCNTSTLPACSPSRWSHTQHSIL